ncbi:hypothetical protein L21SP5_03662 [Salinivirga cyanobacteriivorans]|uniref:Uncharacterized protein n=1 Tax=Salinivirga cyanobacteriivorans TaxID=1307839 RepID=A0A0S2I4T6_9BACT|nr:hypothetical protein L21SP5_03662 [Salinivirga cyanobacteriivorans]
MHNRFFKINANVRGYEAKALLEKTDRTSQSQNFVLQIYIFKRQNEVLAVLKLNSEPTKTHVLPLLYSPLFWCVFDFILLKRLDFPLLTSSMS